MRRRSVLSLLGLGGVGALTAKGLSGCMVHEVKSSAVTAFPFSRCGALAGEQRWAQANEQRSTYRELELEDRLTVPEGFAPSCWRPGVIPSPTAVSGSITITSALSSRARTGRR